MKLFDFIGLWNLYIRCHVEQARLLNEQKKNMEVVVLELPYIFGSTEARLPIWRDVFLNRYVNGHKIAFFSKGGTTMIAVGHNAEAGIGAIEYGKDGERYPIGDENRSFKWMLEYMCKCAEFKITVYKHKAKASHEYKNVMHSLAPSLIQECQTTSK